MANENNKINELVAEDDDPTAELELPNFAEIEAAELEADERTFDVSRAALEDTQAGANVTELRSDLNLRQKTIGKLQHDIEQLRAKWLGLEAEIKARDTQTEDLHKNLKNTNDASSRKDSLIQKRDSRIRSLKSEIRRRDDDFRRLTEDHEALEIRIAELEHPSVEVATKIQIMESSLSLEELRKKHQQTEVYADSLRQKSQDLMESNAHFQRECDLALRQQEAATEKSEELVAQMQSAADEVKRLQDKMISVQAEHENEIRILRFELGSAQDTVVEAEELGSQLAEDLVEARRIKAGLEHQLGKAEEQSTGKLESVRKEIDRLKQRLEGHEQKLTTKNEAISVLLAELAKKTEQIESIGEIEDVIHDIDERMSERSHEIERQEHRSPTERMTRVLVGTVDDQVLRFPLFKDRLTIGRTTDNDIQLKAAFVSRRHAVIQTDGDTTRIIDWGSKNGIHVNSKKTSEHFLSHGDVVTIGNARFRYEERKKRDS